MKEEIYQLKEWHKDARRGLDHVTESFKDAATYLNNCMQALDVVGDLITENERMKEELEQLRAENEELHQQLDDKDIKLNELGKFSANMAKKSSQEELQKALSKFVNKSKQKRIEKRTAVKEMVLEMVVTNNITLPDDLMQTIETLDDEKPMVLSQNTYNAPIGQVVENAGKIVCNE